MWNWIIGKNKSLCFSIQRQFLITIDCTGFMTKCGYKTSLALAEGIMREKYVAVVPGSDFGLPNTLRLSFSSLAYNEGIDRLAVFLLPDSLLHSVVRWGSCKIKKLG